jgi:hypothetical protein
MAVLGMFMQSYVENDKLEQYQNGLTQHEWQRYFDITETLKSENDSIVFDFNLTRLMGENLIDFWRYQGSLTTPPCTEGIIWTMFKQPIVFMEKQFKTLRDNIYFEDYRGPQPLYNRIVYRNFPNETVSSVPDYNRCLFDGQNKINKGTYSIFGIIHFSTYSFILFSSVFCSISMFIFYRTRSSNSKNKFE